MIADDYRFATKMFISSTDRIEKTEIKHIDRMYKKSTNSCVASFIDWQNEKVRSVEKRCRISQRP